MQLRQWCLVGSFVAVSGLGVAAHDFWIEPSSYTPTAESVVRLSLRVGTEFAGDPVARRGDAIESFFMAGPNGRQDVPGREGMDPAGLLRLRASGTVTVGYRSRPTPVTLDAASFEKYLREEGLERIVAARVARGQQQAPGVERFSRSAKTLLVSGGDRTGHDRVLGLTLELVPERHPAALEPDGRFPVRLLYHGRPLEGALVAALSQDGGPPRHARTDRAGRVVLTLAPGIWLIKTVHMVAAPAGSGADWESVWAPLTFKASRG